ncbi:MAG: hypothetical protein SVU32_08750 [Candidatus Nanohaloarchaea archaeon]|nr:hypothetical protein [Candidatus Nanohaloarchaea archaeon]
MAEYGAVDRVEGTVFRLFFLEDKVLKQRKSVGAVAKTLNRYHRLWGPKKTFQRALEMVRQRDRSLRALREGTLDMALLGDLTFQNDVTVTYDDREYLLAEPVLQEKMEPLRFFIRRQVQRRELEEVGKRLEDFVNLQRELWMHRLFDTEMDLRMDYGIDSEGQLRLMDPSVLTDVRDHAETLIEEPLYLNNDFAFQMKLFPYLRRIQPLYIEHITDLTYDELDEYWPA